MIACDNWGEWYHDSCHNSVIPSEAWTDDNYKRICDYCYHFLFLHIANIVQTLFIEWSWLNLAEQKKEHGGSPISQKGP